MIEVTEFAFIGYPVTDIARARAFYEGLLGFKANPMGDSWIEYEVGPHTLAISNMAPDQWKPSSSGPCLALEVKDFEAAVAELRAAKVPFSLEPYESPVCHMFIVRDPDGNSVLIHKRKPGHH